MKKDTQEFNSLTELLLGPIQKHPGMYLGDTKISSLAKFITGYNFGFLTAKAPDKNLDEYFGEQGFLEWFYKKYNLKQTSFWEMPFLNEANGDEEKALHLFFKYLEKYNQHIKQK